MPKGIPNSPNNQVHRRGYGHPSMTPELHRERSAEAGRARVKSGRGHFWTPTEAKAWSIRAYLRSLLRGEVFGKPVKPLTLPNVPPAENWNDQPEDEESE